MVLSMGAILLSSSTTGRWLRVFCRGRRNEVDDGYREGCVLLTTSSSESFCLNLLHTKRAIISSLLTGMYTAPWGDGRLHTDTQCLQNGSLHSWWPLVCSEPSPGRQQMVQCRSCQDYLDRNSVLHPSAGQRIWAFIYICLKINSYRLTSLSSLLTTSKLKSSL